MKYLIFSPWQGIRNTGESYNSTPGPQFVHASRALMAMSGELVLQFFATSLQYSRYTLAVLWIYTSMPQGKSIVITQGAESKGSVAPFSKLIF